MTPELRWLDSLQGSGIRPGLARMRAILRAASNPHRKVPSVIVAGTNGKGSVAATVAAITTAAGIRTGLYTSPHLVSIRERWRIGDSDISARELGHCIRELQRASGQAGIRPTYFEALTLIAFIAFARAECELNVLEVGMGGRLDATNVVRPRLALITTIGLDHREYLGDTIAAIAGEKAGVIHRGTVALTSVRGRTALEVIRSRAREREVPLHLTTRQTIARVPRKGLLELETPSARYRLRPALQGGHQQENLALAVRAAEELRVWFDIPHDAIVSGVAHVRWGGRLEEFRIGRRRVVVDGAHNPDGMRTLVSWVRDELGGEADVVYAAMRDKEWPGMLRSLAPVTRQMWLTQADVSRGETPQALVDKARAAGIEATTAGNPVAAVRAALDSGSSQPVLIAGSLYLAGAVLPFLRKAAAIERASSDQLKVQAAAISPGKRPKRR